MVRRSNARVVLQQKEREREDVVVVVEQVVVVVVVVVAVVVRLLSSRIIIRNDNQGLRSREGQQDRCSSSNKKHEGGRGTGAHKPSSTVRPSRVML